MEIRTIDQSKLPEIETKIPAEKNSSELKHIRILDGTAEKSNRSSDFKNDHFRFYKCFAMHKKMHQLKNLSRNSIPSNHTLSWRQMDHREKVLSLIDKTNIEIFAVTLHFSDFNFNTTEIPPEQKEAILNRLSSHHIALQDLTSELARHRFDDIGRVGDTTNTTASPSNTDEAGTPQNFHDHTYIDQVLKKCAEIIDMLPRLCGAMDKPKISNSPVFNHYTHFDEHLDLGDDVEKMLEHAALVQTMYDGHLHENLDLCSAHFKNPSSKAWKAMSIPDALMRKIHVTFPNLKMLDDGRMCDFQSGLSVQIFDNTDKKRIALAFGGTTSGAQKGNFLERMFGNFNVMIQQWKSNIEALSIISDAIPSNYHQASEFTKIVLAYLKNDPTKKTWNILNVGHSKGGGEAAYAAAINGVYATCFATPESSSALLNAIGPLRLAISSKRIRHFFVKGDVVPQVSGLLSPYISQQFAHFGSGYWMEPSDIVGQGPLKKLWCHDLFFECVITEAIRQKSAKEPRKEMKEELKEKFTPESKQEASTNNNTKTEISDRSTKKRSLFDILNDPTSLSPYHPFQ